MDKESLTEKLLDLVEGRETPETWRSWWDEHETAILFQETYHKESYLELHPTGPKHDYNYHTEAMDRAMEGGIDDGLITESWSVMRLWQKDHRQDRNLFSEETRLRFMKTEAHI